MKQLALNYLYIGWFFVTLVSSQPSNKKNGTDSTSNDCPSAVNLGCEQAKNSNFCNSVKTIAVTMCQERGLKVLSNTNDHYKCPIIFPAEVDNPLSSGDCEKICKEAENECNWLYGLSLNFAAPLKVPTTETVSKTTQKVKPVDPSKENLPKEEIKKKPSNEDKVLEKKEETPKKETSNNLKNELEETPDRSPIPSNTDEELPLSKTEPTGTINNVPDPQEKVPPIDSGGRPEGGPILGENKEIIQADEDVNQEEDDDLDGDEPISPDIKNQKQKQSSSQLSMPLTNPENDINDQFRKADFVGAEDSHFFVYFITFTCLTIMGYIAFHNKNKILALALEGRRGSRSNRRRPNSASYRKLGTSLEEAMASHPSHAPNSPTIY